MKRIPSILLVGFALLAATAPGESKSPDSLERVLPFLDELTVVVARLNLQGLDLNAAAETVARLMTDGEELSLPQEAITAGKAAAESWLNAFRKAGGQGVYVLFSLNDVGREPPVSVVVPVADGGNAEALRELVASAAGFKGESAVKHGCVVAAPAVIMRRLEGLRAAQPMNLQAALAQAPAGLLQAVLLPYAESARVIEELMPTLPAFMGGGSSAAISRGFRWATLSVGSPPDLSAQMTVQLRTGDEARVLANAVLSLLDAIGTAPEVREDVPQWDRARAILTPSVQDNRLVVTLPRPQVELLVKSILWPALHDAKAKASVMRSINNLKQIGVAVLMYAADHGDELPPHLAATLPYLDSAQVLLRPDAGVEVPTDLAQRSDEQKVAWLDRHSPYVYVKPAQKVKEIKDPVSTLLAYEKPQPGNAGPVPVLFADGHVERMNREVIAKHLQRAKEAQK